MRGLVFLAILTVATASVTHFDDKDVRITKEPMVNVDIKTREIFLLKLLNYILQPTVYDDIREVAKEYVLEENVDKYLKIDVVRTFLETYKFGMLPQGETFVHTNDLHVEQAIKVFNLLYFAKDFDIFIRTACWLRERINRGMFVYALTVAVFHRTDCIGINLPPPYEMFPYYFVDSHILHKAFMMKMSKGAIDSVLRDYHGIVVKDNNVVYIDWRKSLRNTLSIDDRITYFTEDIDLNTYYLYLHMMYPSWLNEDIYNVNKERRGEVMAYAIQQLLARLQLERLGLGMCDITPLAFNKPLKSGYWPKLMMNTGMEMPVRSNNVELINDYNLKYKLRFDDIESMIRESIRTGHFDMRDGTTVSLKKVEDIERLGRLLFGGIPRRDGYIKNVAVLIKNILSYSLYNTDSNTYVPTALDLYMTCLRDPVYWKVLKRTAEILILFKNLLPRYTRADFSFPGVKVESITTDKLVTFMDDYDLDITNALYLDKVEMQNRKSNMIYVARMRRLNHHPFKVTIDMVSDKAVDAVVRVFLGPKLDCMGRVMKLNEKRLDFVEIDSFVQKLDTGKNTIVRNSLDMHGVIQQRPWTRTMWDRAVDTTAGVRTVDNWWAKSRVGFPHRLLLPLSSLGGMMYQMFVIVTPVRTGLILPTVDLGIMKERHACRFTSCMDTMPLGFPFDRPIDEVSFFTNNMRFKDVIIYRKDMNTANLVKDVDMSEYVMKHDDLTYLDMDMLVRRSYKDVDEF